MKYHIVTFGCAANTSDSERIASYYAARGFTQAKLIKDADEIIINTCMIRQMAEDRVYGLVNNIRKLRSKNHSIKIIVTGCMVGMAVRDKTGKMMKTLQLRLPAVDAFLPIEEVGFEGIPVRSDPHHAFIPISNGCNNFCTYCVVPYARGREISRPFEEIVKECRDLAEKSLPAGRQGYTRFTLIGQNVNSYGADLVKGQKLKGKSQKVTYVKHLGRLRIPTLFPALLEVICKIDGIEEIDFISSNPWDFSDDLIKVIAENKKISRHIHLPVQSGDNAVLKRMNRWYTKKQYLTLVAKLRKYVPHVTISTDIIVGFCGETEKQFQNTVDLAKKVGFTKAYISLYSDRPMTAAHKTLKDTVPLTEKKRRWMILENFINKPNLKAGTYK
jgi:tRNA-2-methylthio-N6-dimethylallyladenosine synthase